MQCSLRPVDAFMQLMRKCSLSLSRKIQMRASVEHFERLLRDFPSFAPLDLSFTHIRGYMRINDTEYRVQLRTAPNNTLFFFGDGALCSLLAPYSVQIHDLLQASSDAHAFLLELRHFVHTLHSACKQPLSNAHSNSLPTAAFYARVLAEISALDWTRCSLHASLQTVDITLSDSHARSHVLSLHLPPEYPVKPPIASIALPLPLRFSWHSTRSTLRELALQYEKYLHAFQGLWRALDDIDEHAVVQEPERPTRADVYRRIALGRHSSLRIEYAPSCNSASAHHNAGMFPQLRFLGAASHVSKLRDRLNARMHTWDTSGNTLPMQNLQRVLKIDIPKKNDVGVLTHLATECGICYAYRLEHDGKQSAPDVTCDKENCAKPYHKSCLIQWLRAVPDTRQTFDTLVGACVYCEHPISVNVAD